MMFDLLDEITYKRLNHASVRRVFEAIKKNEGKSSVKEISQELELHQGEVSLAVTKLLNEDMIFLLRLERQRRFYCVNQDVVSKKEAALREFLSKQQ